MLRRKYERRAGVNKRQEAVLPTNSEYEKT